MKYRYISRFTLPGVNRCTCTAGVPHYAVPPSVAPDARQRGLFGREHLALMRRWLHVSRRSACVQKCLV